MAHHSPALRGNIHRALKALSPAMAQTHWQEQVRAALGSALGLLFTAAIVAVLHAYQGSGMFLIAPLGASAVLLFAVPNSPLAQPWSAIVGNTVSALSAITVLHLAPEAWAAGIAVGLAIFLMIALRALHPPGGAVALLSVLDAQSVREIGFAFALTPVAATTVLLVAFAIGYNRLTGRVYPFRQPASPQAPSASPPPSRLGLTTAELEELLVRFNQSANLGVADLGRILAAAEMEAASHRFDGQTCADIMTSELLTVPPDAPLEEVAGLYRRHAIKSVPVVDGQGRLLGIIFQADLVEWLLKQPANRRGGMNPLGGAAGARARARDIMNPPEHVFPHDTPVGVLLNLLASQGVQVIPITRAGQLAGIITRSDIINLLLKGASDRDVDGYAERAG